MPMPTQQPLEFELKAAGDAAELTFEAGDAAEPAKLPSFNMVAYNGGPMTPGGWYEDHPVIVDISGMEVSQSVPIDAGHVTDVGHSTAVEKTPGNQKLKARGVLSAYDLQASDEEAVAARKMVRMGGNGFPFQASIQARVSRKNIEFIRAGDSVKVNGKTFAGPVSVARKSTLQKIAILSLGADSTTSTTIAAKPLEQNMEFTAYVVAAGFDPAKLSETETKLLTAMWEGDKAKKAATAPVVPPVDLAAEIRVKAAAETKRISDIAEICAASPNLKTEIEVDGKKTAVNIQAHAVAQGWDAERTKAIFAAEQRVEEIRAGRGAPAVIMGGQSENRTLEALQGALLLRSGVQLDDPVFQTNAAIALGVPAFLRAGLNTDARQKAMEHAWKYRNISMIDIAKESIRLAGKQVPHSDDDVLQAAFSGGTLANIFTTNINTMILMGYSEAGDTSGAWTQTVDVADFKTNERPRIKTGAGLTAHPRGGEADHTAFSDTMESYKISRFSRQHVIDEQDIIDDAFNSMSDIPRRMGRAALRLRPDLVYSILLANPTMADGTAVFGSGATRGNLGSSSALAAATLKAGISAMRLLQENSVNLDINPTHLIVPQTLSWTAAELMNSANIVITGTTDAVRGGDNVLKSLLQIVPESRLENGLTDPASGTAYGGSASTWFLACANEDTIQVAYRRGTGRAPVVRSWTLSEGKFGVGYDVSLDIGAKTMDWRGMRKTTA
jgi:hypothetical protein